MLKIELVKFETQDVITASGVTVMPACSVTGGAHPNSTVTVQDGKLTMVCTACGKSVTGTTIVGGN